MLSQRNNATQKCYMADTGLLVTHSFRDNNYTDNEIYRAIPEKHQQAMIIQRKPILLVMPQVRPFSPLHKTAAPIFGRGDGFVMQGFADIPPRSDIE